MSLFIRFISLCLHEGRVSEDVILSHVDKMCILQITVVIFSLSLMYAYVTMQQSEQQQSLT